MQWTRNNSGFTLVEMIVAIGIFTIVAVAAVSALASVIDANQRSQSLAQANNNLDFTLQTMVREIRNGFAYGCDAEDASSTPSSSSDCKNVTEFGFVDANRDGIGYQYNSASSTIERVVNGNTSNLQVITPPEVSVTHLQFDVVGADTDKEQSRVIITIKAQAGSGDNSRTLNLQTTATQRLLYSP